MSRCIAGSGEAATWPLLPAADKIVGAVVGAPRTLRRGIEAAKDGWDPAD